MKLRKTQMTSLLVLLLLLTACQGGDGVEKKMLDADKKSFVLKEVSGLQKVAQLTGKGSLNQTDQYAVYGTDLGSMIHGEEATYFVFGDTFGEREEGMTGGGGSFWRSNVLAYSTDKDPSDGITFDGMITDELGLAKELLPSPKIDYDEMTKIPTHGVFANGNLYLYYMSVNHWGEPGRWDANYSSAAKSSDQGNNWSMLDQLKWPGDSHFIQVSPYKVPNGDGNDIYFWTIPSGRFGGVKLMKVKEADIENLAAYNYFAGTDASGEPIWSSKLDDAAMVLDDTVGELSVIWNPYLERWIMAYLKESQGVVMREGLTPWGPWGEPIEMVSSAEYPGLYAPFMSPQYMEDDGRTLYFTLSLWDPYNVFWFKVNVSK